MKRQRAQKRYPNPAVTKEPMVAEPGSPAETAIRRTSKPPGRRGAPARSKRLSRSERYRKAAALLREWMADDSGYDEEIWPALERELKDVGIRLREDFE